MTNLSLTITTIDDEPRIRDLDLAERLGYAEPRMIRKLIERHLPQLDKFGICSMVSQNAGKRGRPSYAYMLNEDQATYIANSSETPKALEIKVEIIKVFGAYRRGQLVPVAPAAPTFPVPTNLGEALQLAASEYFQRVKLEARLEVTEAIIDDKLNHMTVDAFCSTHCGMYLSLGEKIGLGKRATKFASERGIVLGCERRVVTTKWNTKKPCFINVYPTDLLVEAAKQIGLIR